MSSATQALARLAAVRTDTLTLVEGLSEEDMQWRPVSGGVPKGWSPGELLDHLLLTEELYRSELEELVRLARAGRRPYLNRLVSDLPLPFLDLLPAPLLALATVPLTVMGAFVPARVVETFLRFPLIKAQAPPALTPRGDQNGEELRRQLRNSLAALQALYADNADLDFRRFTYQHPILGITDGVALVGVIASHELRHQDQLRRILAAVRS